MKKNILPLLAIVFAIAVSSFTTTRFQIRYIVYKGTGDQTIGTSYNAPVANPPGTLSGTGILNWMRINDADNDNVADNSEVSSAFNTYNVTASVPATLNDEVDKSSELDVKSPL